MQYLILESSTAEKLTAEVEEKIGEGWTPLGGVSCSIAVGEGDWHESTYVQAVVKALVMVPPGHSVYPPRAKAGSSPAEV